MRIRLACHCLTLCFILGEASCYRREVELRPTIEDEPKSFSIVHVNNEAESKQLTGGFYGVEQGTWRWTQRRFSVMLSPPLRSSISGAKLIMNFSIPDAVASKFHELTISATVAGQVLPDQRFTGPGAHTYTALLTGASLANDLVPAAFTLDHYLPAGTIDRRELGIIVVSVGLEHP